MNEESLLKIGKPQNIKNTKFKKHVTDPPRYPGVINKYEGDALKVFKDESSELFGDIIRLLVDYVK